MQNILGRAWVSVWTQGELYDGVMFSVVLWLNMTLQQQLVDSQQALQCSLHVEGMINLGSSSSPNYNNKDTVVSI